MDFGRLEKRSDLFCYICPPLHCAVSVQIWNRLSHEYDSIHQLNMKILILHSSSKCTLKYSTRTRTLRGDFSNLTHWSLCIKMELKENTGALPQYLQWIQLLFVEHHQATKFETQNLTFYFFLLLNSLTIDLVIIHWKYPKTFLASFVLYLELGTNVQ